MGRMENRVEVPVQAPGALPPYARVPPAPIWAVEQDWEPLVIQRGLGCGLDGIGDHGCVINPPSTRRVQSACGPPAMVALPPKGRGTPSGVAAGRGFSCPPSTRRV